MGLNSFHTLLLMKIYTDQPLPFVIPLEKLDKTYKYSKYVQEEFYSSEGTYISEHDELYRLSVVDKPIEMMETEYGTLFIDRSYFTKNKAFHLGVDYEQINIYKYVFHLDTISAVIECKKSGGKFTPCDIYFTMKNTNDSISEITIRSINEFLSGLK